jgi:hypothetical protein
MNEIDIYKQFWRITDKQLAACWPSEFLKVTLDNFTFEGQEFLEEFGIPYDPDPESDSSELFGFGFFDKPVGFEIITHEHKNEEKYCIEEHRYLEFYTGSPRNFYIQEFTGIIFEIDPEMGLVYVNRDLRTFIRIILLRYTLQAQSLELSFELFEEFIKTLDPDAMDGKNEYGQDLFETATYWESVLHV